MQVINIKDEDIINYKEISMFIGTPFCSGKCWKELGLPSSICQNNNLRVSNIIEITTCDLVERYLNNPLSKAIVFGGMEPLDSFNDIVDFLKELRQNYNCKDTVVIYTGYKEEEIEDKLNILRKWGNVIIKVGRYIPNRKSRFDELLGVTLISDNQYAIKL